MTTTQRIITVAAVVLGTMATRFLPFLIFPENKNPPKFIIYLGDVLPYAVMGMLVVYCLRDAVFSEYHALPELLSIVAVVITYKMRRSTLLSISVGTVLYMLLIQNVFIA